MAVCTCRHPEDEHCEWGCFCTEYCSCAKFTDQESIPFTKAECKLLHTLVDGYVVGPDVRKVLIKLKEAASL